LFLGWTALHSASYRGHEGIVHILLHADVTRTSIRMAMGTMSNEPIFPSPVATSSTYVGTRNEACETTNSTQDKSTVRLVDVMDDDNRTALHLAAEANQTTVIQLLLESDGSPDLRDLDGCTPLILACARGFLVSANVLIESGCDLDERSLEGRTALMEAAGNGHLPVVESLVQAGCHVNVQDCHGYSALSEAAAAGDLAIVNMLIAGGADTEGTDTRGRTALHVAALHGHNDVCSRLIHVSKNLDIQDHDGYTSTMLAAWDPWQRGTFPTLQNLAMRGANLDIVDVKGISPLFKAWEHPEHVLLLIQHGCNVTLKSHAATSIIELAALQDKWCLVYLLLAAGFDRSTVNLSRLAVRDTPHPSRTHLTQLLTSPNSLRDTARLAIRANLHRPTLNHTACLPLPPILRDFVAFKVFL